MDTAVRQMLSKAENEEQKDYLLEAFEKLKRGRKVASNQIDPFSSDLYVICGEVALKVYYSLQYTVLYVLNNNKKFKKVILKFQNYIILLGKCQQMSNTPYP